MNLNISCEINYFQWINLFFSTKNDLKENKREHLPGAVISGFHFYELKDPPGKHNTVILVAVVTEEWMPSSVSFNL